MGFVLVTVAGMWSTLFRVIFHQTPIDSAWSTSSSVKDCPLFQNSPQFQKESWHSRASYTSCSHSLTTSARLPPSRPLMSIRPRPPKRRTISNKSSNKNDEKLKRYFTLQIKSTPRIAILAESATTTLLFGGGSSRNANSAPMIK